MKQLQLSDRQSNFIFYLVHEGKGRTEAVRRASFAAPRQSAFTLTQSPKIMAKIRQMIIWNLLEYNNEPMLAIAIVLEDYMGQYGIVWNSSVVEVAGIESARPIDL